MNNRNYQVPAVVVALDANGLSICRSLGRRRIPVYALWSNWQEPGRRTRYARPVSVKDVTSKGLIEDLVRLRRCFDQNPILYLTSDDMIKNVAASYDEISAAYQLDWPNPDLLLKLLDKRNLEAIVKDKGMRWPKTHVVSNLEELEVLMPSLLFPVLLKPAIPPSPYKAFKVHSCSELFEKFALARQSISSFIVQEWIPGDERSLYFVQYYFDCEHRPVTGFVGRKVRSRPRLTGNTCSAEIVDRPDLWEEGLRFFKGLCMRGTASIEFKVNEEGLPYVIEPTVGRTDYWNGIGMANGVDIPFLRYALTSGYDPNGFRTVCAQKLWVDFGRDCQLFAEGLASVEGRRSALHYILSKKSYAVWAWDDPWPAILSWPRGLMGVFIAACRKLLKLVF